MGATTSFRARRSTSTNSPAAQLADIPFILNEGITVNSAELGVVDNTFMPMPIPEPSKAFLLMAGLAALTWRRR